MSTNRQKIVIVGAGINGLVAANYLQRGGCDVTIIERKDKVGGACVSETTEIDGVIQKYALGASVFGSMQDFVFNETGLSKRLKTYVSPMPEILFFPGDENGARYYHDQSKLSKELKDKWGENGDLVKYCQDLERMTKYLQKGFREAKTPSLQDAISELGESFTELWISGTARSLLDHYFTSDKLKIYMMNLISETGPVSPDQPYTAFTLPLMGVGTVFDGSYGFVEEGIWRVTEELAAIDKELGITIHLSSAVSSIDTDQNTVQFTSEEHIQTIAYDHLLLTTDPRTASQLVGTPAEIEKANQLQARGSAGKLNLMFKNHVRWKDGEETAFRYLFMVDTFAEFERVTMKITDKHEVYAPGFMQVYCEGAANRQMNNEEPFDRISVFFKNLSLGEKGEALEEVETQVKKTVLSYIENPEDCIWTRLLTPRDLQELFFFPEGNIDHTMLTGGQTFCDRTFSNNPEKDFYNFGELDNVYLCGAGAYPMGSIAGTVGYMCGQQLLRKL